MTEIPAAPALPPQGAIAHYTYDAAHPTPGKRTQLVLVTGHDVDEQGNATVRGLVLGDVNDQATFRVDQLAPAP